ncbi:hypothetical protein BCY86_04480 [Pajaroellobacter abortibovis]|uniref:Type II secretion system protein J n=2 Tax=Pajaroellobacter abortibovis TaxID=1882918 RepID=A0A1L6MWV4_9BACT|nr:hypothetical protein BCY86_04480 [Pajaroellobacter abortibovis]
MTLLEIMISLAIFTMIALLTYGSFNALSRSYQIEITRGDRSREARRAILRIVRELSSAFLSTHQPMNAALVTRVTAFIGENGGNFDRVDFTAFVHRHIERDAKESDQAEVGYFVRPNPNHPGQFDLVRREQTPIDTEPKHGGILDIMVENVELFNIRYFDPSTGNWLDSWDSRQATGQLNRLPFEVQVTLVLKGVHQGSPSTYMTKTLIPIQQPLRLSSSP